ncbi:MAG: 2-C-methyl-D-erythritol 4-phosphate cytidylyltransferase [Actinomycetota bacterium]|jgi:2-C-methyl-D-erythritol 4-phosphate cytidylyltransferase|nr:hypothetical protein [Actinomycetota bacterium]
MRKRQRPSSTKFLPHKLAIVVTAGSPIAFQSLNGTNLITKALSVAHQFSVETSLSNKLYVATNDLKSLEEATKTIKIKFTTLDCYPNSPSSLAKVIEPIEFEMIAIHDSQRPLTRSTQFHRALEGLFGCDAVRPTMAFTETLKTLNDDLIVMQTIDRTKIKRISSPEIIRQSAIDFDGLKSTWTLPLKTNTRLSEVEADPDSLKINREEEILLMEAFLHWQQKVVN